jgi:hypothetical protein
MYEKNKRVYLENYYIVT